VTCGSWAHVSSAEICGPVFILLTIRRSPWSMEVTWCSTFFARHANGSGKKTVSFSSVFFRQVDLGRLTVSAASCQIVT